MTTEARFQNHAGRLLLAAGGDSATVALLPLAEADELPAREVVEFPSRREIRRPLPSA